MLERLKHTGWVKKAKMPREVNQRAKATLDLITGDRAADPEPVKDPRRRARTSWRVKRAALLD
jgi:hypothetical protein